MRGCGTKEQGDLSINKKTMNQFEESQNTQEQGEKIVVNSREDAVSKILDEFRKRLRERFTKEGEDKDSPEFKEVLDFHELGHSEGVMEWTTDFLEEVRSIDPSLVTEEDIDLGKVESLGHDLVQEAKTDTPPMRQRARGANEEASAREVIAEMAKYVLPDGKPVFDINFVTRSALRNIALTVPTLKPNFAKLPDGSMGLEMNQPDLTPGLSVVEPPKGLGEEELVGWREQQLKELYKTVETNKEASLIGLAIASADLRGELASSDPEDFRKSGDAEFRELNITITEEVKDWRNITPERRAKIVGAILGWKKVQTGFAKWQRLHFITSVEQNSFINQSDKSEEIKKALFKKFGLPEDDAVFVDINKREDDANFWNNIKLSEQRAKELEDKFGKLRDENSQVGDEEFKEILESIGYQPS